nr:MAG TPA: hypothetical protein [Caudoviricetes sp.]DAW51743.1 MAG TPA: hypothetical protein [Bacteriophage sp.]
MLKTFPPRWEYQYYFSHHGGKIFRVSILNFRYK